MKNHDITKFIFQVITIITFIGKYPRDLQFVAPSIFLLIGIGTYILYDKVWDYLLCRHTAAYKTTLY